VERRLELVAYHKCPFLADTKVLSRRRYSTLQLDMPACKPIRGLAAWRGRGSQGLHAIYASRPFAVEQPASDAELQLYDGFYPVTQTAILPMIARRMAHFWATQWPLR